MMTNPKMNKRLPELKDWAAKKLGASPGASWNEVRAAFLQQLPSTNFVPPPTSDESFRYLSVLLRDSESSVPPASALFEEENRLRQEVERYADAFFTFSVTSRKQKWILLFSRCSWLPPLTAWLEALKPGLSIDLSVLDSAAVPVQRLISRLCFLFTLRPPERAQRRFDILQTFARDKSLWKNAAQLVRDRHPALAALDRNLMDTLLRDTGLGDSPPQDKIDTN